MPANYPVRYEVIRSWARITIDRPDTYNSLDTTAADLLVSSISRAADDPSVRAVLLTGAGGAFSSGLDLSEPVDFEELRSRDDEPVRDNLNTHFHPSIIALRTMQKPTVALISGPAVGIGASFALSCDLLLMTQSSYLQIAFVGIGLIPDGGSTALLTARAGAGRALEASLLGDKISAAAAVASGLASRVIPDEDTTSAEQLLDRLANGPTAAYAAVKQAINAVAFPRFDEQLELEATLQDRTMRTFDAEEGIRAFREKRRPEFSGR
jgi:2-(1,2-epoxy-1,2-dihydrophenyl)acetyl-CoA isomerase